MKKILTYIYIYIYMIEDFIQYLLTSIIIIIIVY